MGGSQITIGKGRPRKIINRTIMKVLKINDLEKCFFFVDNIASFESCI